MSDIEPQSKPKELLILEEAIGLHFELKSYSPLLEDGKIRVGSSAYSIDKNNNVLALHIDSAKEFDSDFLSPFKHLKQLSFENMSINNWVSQEIALNIEELNFYNIKHIPELYSLYKLKILLIRRSEGTLNCDFLDELRELDSLVIQNVTVSSISFLRNLKKLRVLYLGNNQLSEIECIQDLKNLETLSIWENKISDINVLEFLPKLKFVHLQDNKISNIDSLSSHNNLRKVDIQNNLIKDIPFSILKNNTELIISRTQEREISYNEMIVYGNPLSSPPFSVIDLGMTSILSYFDNKERYGARPLNEGRIILVGDGSAGKSSLMERILGNGFDQNRKQTDGIVIKDWHIKKENRDLRFNMWDFGGQEVQHAVHKFFFTSGCLYILVLDNRKEEEPEYWLQQIETLGTGAPVLVVFNKSDQNSVENANRKFLKDKYPNIVGFYNISCASGIGLHDFQISLEEQAAKLSTVDDQFPGNWFKLKEEIENATGDDHNYLVYDAYLRLCVKNGVNDVETQRLLLRYFSYIGTVTWFGESNAFLEHMHVLKPAWITQGVYKIITGKKTESLKGHINISDFKELLQPAQSQDYTYNESHYGYILGLMKKFELCYTDENDQELLIPSRFSKEPKIEYSDFKGVNIRTYILQFKDYLPVAIIHQFIVRNINRAFEKNYWYEGIVIQDKDNVTVAMVQLDRLAKRIYIRIKGDSAVGLWSYVREEFYTITERYASLPYSEQVSLTEDDNGQIVEYQDLISHLHENRPKYFHAKLRRDFDVSYLIGLFESKETTLEKYERGLVQDENGTFMEGLHQPEFILNIQNILNNSNQNITSSNVHVDIHIDVKLVNKLVNEIKEDSNYLISELKGQNSELTEALNKAILFSEEASGIKQQDELKGKGWTRKLKGIAENFKLGAEIVKLIPEGSEALEKIIHALSELAQYLGVNPPGSI